MNLGAENRKKTIIAGSLGMVAVICVGYMLWTLFGGSSAPVPPASIVSTPKPVMGITAPVVIAAPTTTGGASAAAKPVAMPTGNTAGVAATKIASASASLDPTLDEAAMLRTEHLVYSGVGRNIFSASYTPPPPPIPVAIASARKGPVVPPPPPQPPPPPPTCPPSCPPINLKFFGVATDAKGKRQAFLLDGDDVFLAAAGDIVARKYRIVTVNANTIQVEDLTNKNTQSLPLSN